MIEVDTDGIYFVPPDKDRNRRIARWFSEGIARGIEIDFDEQFDAMFSYKAKNYALLTKDGEVIIKGGALKSRGLEKFQRVFPGGNDQAHHGRKTRGDHGSSG